jgi:hypothetical protein
MNDALITIDDLVLEWETISGVSAITFEEGAIDSMKFREDFVQYLAEQLLDARARQTWYYLPQLPKEESRYWCYFASEGGYYGLAVYYPFCNTWVSLNKCGKSENESVGLVAVKEEVPICWTYLPKEKV